MVEVKPWKAFNALNLKSASLHQSPIIPCLFLKAISQNKWFNKPKMFSYICR
jgi:hypothetical protein